MEFGKKTDAARRKGWRLNKKRPLVQQGSKHADNRTRTCTVAQRHLKPPRLPIPPYPHKKECSLAHIRAGSATAFLPYYKVWILPLSSSFPCRDERGHADRSLRSVALASLSVGGRGAPDAAGGMKRIQAMFIFYGKALAVKPQEC